MPAARRAPIFDAITSVRLASLLAVEPDFDPGKLPTLDLREGFRENLRQHRSRWIVSPHRLVIHQHHPYAWMPGRRRAQEIRRGLSREIAVVKACSMAGEEDLRTELRREMWA